MRGEYYSHFHLSVDLVRQIFKVVFLVVLMLCIYGCTSEERKLRQEIINASNKSKTEQVSLDFSKITGRTVKKICVQEQYTIERLFVEAAKMPSPGFEDVDEGEFVLWIYFESGPPIQVRLGMGELMPPKHENLCMESSVLQIEQKTIVFN